MMEAVLDLVYQIIRRITKPLSSAFTTFESVKAELLLEAKSTFFQKRFLLSNRGESS
jgi:hypothetical protein